MIDLVERLRDGNRVADAMSRRDMDEAAEEIERLRLSNARLNAILEQNDGLMVARQDEIERLECENAANNMDLTSAMGGIHCARDAP